MNISSGRILTYCYTGATEKATVSHTEIIRASKVCAEGVASKPGDTL